MRMATLAPTLWAFLSLGSSLQLVSGQADLKLPHNPSPNPTPKAGTIHAFLGVHFVPIPPEVIHQTPSITSGGLLIEFLVADSPATAAGLQKYDLLARADNQVIFNEQQFIGLLMNKRPGETVALQIIRQGKPLEIKPVLGANSGPLENEETMLRQAQAKQEAAKLLLDFLRKNPQVGASYPEMLQNLIADASRLKPSAPPSNQKVVQATDDEGKLEMRTESGTTTVKFENTVGQVTYTGTFPANEVKQNLPQMLRERLERVEKRMKEVAVPMGAGR